MTVIHFKSSFVRKCDEFVRRHPELGEDGRDFIRRCGRLGAREVERLGRKIEEEIGEIKVDRDEFIGVYVTPRDFKRIEELCERYQLFPTAGAFYIFATFMVMAGYWKLPEKI